MRQGTATLVFLGIVTMVTTGNTLGPSQLLSCSTCKTAVQSALTIFLAQGRVAIGVEVEFEAITAPLQSHKLFTLVTPCLAFCPTLILCPWFLQT